MTMVKMGWPIMGRKMKRSTNSPTTDMIRAETIRAKIKNNHMGTGPKILLMKAGKKRQRDEAVNNEAPEDDHLALAEVENSSGPENDNEAQRHQGVKHALEGAGGGVYWIRSIRNSGIWGDSLLLRYR